jgi:hypothetical protein
MSVIASSVADVVASVGGLLFDRRMAGWTVDVLVADRCGERALQILGASTLDLDEDFEAITTDPEWIRTFAVAADIYAVDERVRGLPDVTLWGDTSQLGHDVDSVCYRLSGAAQMFKAEALAAAGMPNYPVEATEALFRCGVTALAPVAARS